MIISVSGLIGSGKDTVAGVLVEQHGFVKESFAGTLKDAVSAIFGFDRNMLEGKTKEAREQREQVDQWWAKRLNIPHLTPRWVLQHFGTDVMRTHFHTDIWVASLEHKIHTLTNSGQDIVVSDARFINELSMLSDAGAKTVRVKRGSDPVWWDTAEKAHAQSAAMEYMVSSDIHRSEWDWASYKFDKILTNDSTLFDLSLQVNHLVI